jgi:hypothetical protein
MLIFPNPLMKVVFANRQSADWEATSVAYVSAAEAGDWSREA